MIFERQRAGAEPGVGERAGDVVDEPGVEELAGREVHRNAQVQIGMLHLPPRGLRAGLAEDPATELDDDPGLLGHRDELDAARAGRGGVLPAHQRLESGRSRPSRGAPWAGSARRDRPRPARAGAPLRDRDVRSAASCMDGS